MQAPFNLLLARRGRGIDMEFLNGLWNGEPGPWITVGVCIAFVIGMAIAQKYFGFKILDRKERRRAMERRKHVIWKYERDS